MTLSQSALEENVWITNTIKWLKHIKILLGKEKTQHLVSYQKKKYLLLQLFYWNSIECSTCNNRGAYVLDKGRIRKNPDSNALSCSGFPKNKNINVWSFLEYYFSFTISSSHIKYQKCKILWNKMASLENDFISSISSKPKIIADQNTNSSRNLEWPRTFLVYVKLVLIRFFSYLYRHCSKVMVLSDMHRIWFLPNVRKPSKSVGK